jgi:hypothetical protein
MGIRTPIRIGLEVIHVTFWQRTSLHFVYTIRLCERLSIKVADSFGGRHSKAAMHLNYGMGISGYL